MWWDSWRVRTAIMILVCCCRFAHGEFAAVSITGRPAAQSTTLSGYPAAKAVDDKLATFSHTTPDAHPWWQVDLASEYCLGRITVTLRQNCCDQFRFITAVARAGLSAGYAENRPCGRPATRAQSQTGAVSEFLCDTPRMARYVSFDIDPSSPGVTHAVLQIAEVVVEEFTSGECDRNNNRTPKFTSAFFETLHTNGLIANPEPLSTEVARSLPLCADICINRASCLSFDFAPGNRQCHLYSLNSTNINTIPTNGSSVYVLLK